MPVVAMSNIEELLRFKDRSTVFSNVLVADEIELGLKRIYAGEWFLLDPALELSSFKLDDKEVNFIVKDRIWNLSGVSVSAASENVKLSSIASSTHSSITFTSSIESSAEAKISILLKSVVSDPVKQWDPEVRDRFRNEVKISCKGNKNSVLFSYNDNCFLSIKVFSEGAKVMVRQTQTNVFEVQFLLEGTLIPKEKFNVKVVYSFYENDTFLDEDKEWNMAKSLTNVPKISLKSEDLKKLYYFAWASLLSNRVTLKNHKALPYSFTMPSKLGYRHQWLWDSAFHSIVLSNYDIKLAKEELMNLFVNQKEDGRIPHEIFLTKEICKSIWGVDDYSPWTTQPPVIAVAVDRIISKEKDKKFIEIALGSLIKYDEWFRKFRDEDKDGLIAYHDPLESGWDNSKRWDAYVKKEKKYISEGMFPIEAVDLNSLIFVQRKVIGNLARLLGYKKLSEEYEDLSAQLKEKIVNIMWDDSKKFFFDVEDRTHNKTMVKTPAAFLTLFAKVATKEQANYLVEHLVNEKEFKRKLPLPTLSADDPDYNPRNFWRGPTWINLVWFTYNGLLNYGFKDVAKDLAGSVIEAMAKNTTCNEYYDSETGEPLGVRYFGWSSLITDIILKESEQ
ncbi:MAG: amylo-alpha-1,6-glucosidase [Thermoproteota archaeon]